MRRILPHFVSKPKFDKGGWTANGADAMVGHQPRFRAYLCLKEAMDGKIGSYVAPKWVQSGVNALFDMQGLFAKRRQNVVLQICAKNSVFFTAGTRYS